MNTKKSKWSSDLPAIYRIISYGGGAIVSHTSSYKSRRIVWSKLEFQIGKITMKNYRLSSICTYLFVMTTLLLWTGGMQIVEAKSFERGCAATLTAEFTYSALNQEGFKFNETIKIPISANTIYEVASCSGKTRTKAKVSACETAARNLIGSFWSASDWHIGYNASRGCEGSIYNTGTIRNKIPANPLIWLVKTGCRYVKDGNIPEINIKNSQLVKIDTLRIHAKASRDNITENSGGNNSPNFDKEGITEAVCKDATKKNSSAPKQNPPTRSNTPSKPRRTPASTKPKKPKAPVNIQVKQTSKSEKSISCPGRLHFTGRIRFNEPGEYFYWFLSNGGKSTKGKKLVTNGSGIKDFYWNRPVGSRLVNDQPDREGWVQLLVRADTKNAKGIYKSKKTNFEVTCSTGKRVENKKKLK